MPWSPSSSGGYKVPGTPRSSASTTGSLCAGADPSLASVDICLEDVGRIAAQHLLLALHGKPTYSAHAVPCRLIVRDCRISGPTRHDEHGGHRRKTLREKTAAGLRRSSLSDQATEHSFNARYWNRRSRGSCETMRRFVSGRHASSLSVSSPAAVWLDQSEVAASWDRPEDAVRR